MSRRKLTGYCTKYALSSGIMPMTVELGDDPKYGYSKGRVHIQVVIDRDFFVSREEAETAAKEMARRKYRALLAQAAKVLRLSETPKHAKEP